MSYLVSTVHTNRFCLFCEKNDVFSFNKLVFNLQFMRLFMNEYNMRIYELCTRLGYLYVVCVCTPYMNIQIHIFVPTTRPHPPAPAVESSTDKNKRKPLFFCPFFIGIHLHTSTFLHKPSVLQVPSGSTSPKGLPSSS